MVSQPARENFVDSEYEDMDNEKFNNRVESNTVDYSLVVSLNESESEKLEIVEQLNMQVDPRDNTASDHRDSSDNMDSDYSEHTDYSTTTCYNSEM